VEGTKERTLESHVASKGKNNANRQLLQQIV
jgi:hypothetical protein